MNGKELIEALATGLILKGEDISAIEETPAEEIKAALIDRFKRQYALVIAREQERRKSIEK